MRKPYTLCLLSAIAFLGAPIGPFQSAALGAVPPLNSVETENQQTKLSFEKVKKKFGLTYFSFFNGPGLHPDSFFYSPNQLGRPGNDGINFLNQFSIRYKFSKNLAIDLQSRFYLIVNNYTSNADFKILRWEAPRIGISGLLLSGEDWTLTGAINTDFPYFLPSPFTGYQARERTTILTPGMFAGFKYKPKGSRWSVFSVVNPRFFIYADRTAQESQMTSGGFAAGNKAELILGFQPTLNYQISENTSFSLGTTIDYRKQVVSDWNIFDASLIMNGESKAWRLAALPINIGVTFNISPEINLFPFIAAYPISSQRFDVKTQKQAGFLESASFGMWLSGTVF